MSSQTMIPTRHHDSVGNLGYCWMAHDADCWLLTCKLKKLLTGGDYLGWTRTGREPLGNTPFLMTSLLEVFTLDMLWPYG